MKKIEVSNCVDCPLTEYAGGDDKYIDCTISDLWIESGKKLDKNCPLKKEPIKIELEAGSDERNKTI